MYDFSPPFYFPHPPSHTLFNHFPLSLSFNFLKKFKGGRVGNFLNPPLSLP